MCVCVCHADELINCYIAHTHTHTHTHTPGISEYLTVQFKLNSYSFGYSFWLSLLEESVVYDPTLWLLGECVRLLVVVESTGMFLW